MRQATFDANSPQLCGIEQRKSYLYGVMGGMHPLPKIPTGIGGFDELSRGGLPRGRTTLLKGGPGSGNREKELLRIRSADPARPVSTLGISEKGAGRVRAMRPRKAKKSAPVTTVVVMRLYIANSAPNSVKAIANLEAICKKHLPEGFRLEIIDVLEFPQRALADGILVTPSLAKVSPSPAAKIVGDLSDRASVLLALGVKP